MEINVYDHRNSNFVSGPYKRLEIGIGWETLFPIKELDNIIEEHFPGVDRDRLMIGTHVRTTSMWSSTARQYLYLVVQANGEF